MSDEATKLPADYGIVVGTEWIDDDEGEVVTVTGIDDPATMYPISFRWNDGHEGADDVEGFCASFRPRDWTALATSEAALRAESASLRERLATAEAALEAERRSLTWERDDAASKLATAESLALTNGEALAGSREALQSCVDSENALRAERDELRGLLSEPAELDAVGLCVLCGDYPEECAEDAVCFGGKARTWLRAHPAIPGEPNGASETKGTR